MKKPKKDNLFLEGLCRTDENVTVVFIFLNHISYRFRTLEHEFDGVKTHFDDEVQQREECGHQLNKAVGEMNHWRSKYEHEALVRIEELEATKIKLQVR